MAELRTTLGSKRVRDVDRPGTLDTKELDRALLLAGDIEAP